MHTIKLPITHAQDWLSRCDTETTHVVSQTTRTITLELSDSDLEDLISDAKYYAECMGPDSTGDFDYRPRARTCLKSLERQGYLK